MIDEIIKSVKESSFEGFAREICEVDAGLLKGLASYTRTIEKLLDDHYPNLDGRLKALILDGLKYRRMQLK